MLTITKAGNEIAKITSTWNNAQKGFFLQEWKMIQDTRGRPVTLPGEVEITTGTILAQIIGFTPSEAGRIRDMDAFNKALEAHRKTVADSAISLMWDYSREVQTARTEEEREAITDRFFSMQQIMYSTLRTPRDKQLVRESVQRVITGKSKRGKAIKKFLENFNDGRLADIHTLHASFIARGLLQTMGPVED